MWEFLKTTPKDRKELHRASVDVLIGARASSLVAHNSEPLAASGDGLWALEPTTPSSARAGAANITFSTPQPRMGSGAGGSSRFGLAVRTASAEPGGHGAAGGSCGPNSTDNAEHGPTTARSTSSFSPRGSATSISRRLSKLLTATVNFRDVQFVTKVSSSGFRGEDSMTMQRARSATPPPLHHGAHHALEGDAGPAADAVEGDEEEEEPVTEQVVKKNKLILIMCGLPARGKTFLCNKLMRYLNWQGHETRHFNVGQYRRRQQGDEVQDAAFFDHSNPAGMEARQRALNAALDDMLAWLATADSQVAIFDATNTTDTRRQYLRQKFHGNWQYMFIESICQDEDVLRANYLAKIELSPDYKGMDTEAALADFKSRIQKYEAVYEPLGSDASRVFHYVQLTDMTTGRGHMSINRISGYLQGRIVFFLMQVCKAGQATRRIWLTRHGQSEYNRAERLGGDSSISEDGQLYASLLPAALLSRLPQGQEGGVSVSVWTSTLKRTIQTARHLPFPKLQWKALDEIDAGICDGMTYHEIAKSMPAEFEARKKDKLRYRYPSGESYLDLTQRLEPVIAEIERQRESMCIVSHQAVLRVVLGYFMGIPLEEVPSLEVPLHTLLELTPMPDGTMRLERLPVDITRGEEQFALPEDVTGPAVVDTSTPPANAMSPGLPQPDTPDSLSSCTTPLTGPVAASLVAAVE